MADFLDHSRSELLVRHDVKRGDRADARQWPADSMVNATLRIRIHHHPLGSWLRGGCASTRNDNSIHADRSQEFVRPGFVVKQIIGHARIDLTVRIESERPT